MSDIRFFCERHVSAAELQGAAPDYIEQVQRAVELKVRESGLKAVQHTRILSLDGATTLRWALGKVRPV